MRRKTRRIILLTILASIVAIFGANTVYHYNVNQSNSAFQGNGFVNNTMTHSDTGFGNLNASSFNSKFSNNPFTHVKHAFAFSKDRNNFFNNMHTHGQKS